jgi:hypothetical protein
MVFKVTSTQKLNLLAPIYCTVTGKRLVAESHKQFDIPDGLVTWFQCEACQGWHIVIDDARPITSSIISLTANQYLDAAGGELQQIL